MANGRTFLIDWSQNLSNQQLVSIPWSIILYPPRGWADFKTFSLIYIHVYLHHGSHIKSLQVISESITPGGFFLNTKFDCRLISHCTTQPSFHCGAKTGLASRYHHHSNSIFNYSKLRLISSSPAAPGFAA